jgi:hypothetical protein
MESFMREPVFLYFGLEFAAVGAGVVLVNFNRPLLPFISIISGRN